jgi:NarL family two-component system response regulator LiaR
MYHDRCAHEKRGLELEPSELRKTKILLADDHPLMRRALRDVLEREPDFEVVGEAGNGSEAIELTERHGPDVVIMDISMPGMTGVEATKRIKSSLPSTSVLILTVHTDIHTIVSILQAGASGYLVKSIFGPEVVHTIRALMDGDLVLAPSISKAVVEFALRHVEKPISDRAEDRKGIAPRNMQVLALAARGMSNKEIGARLGITEATVKGHFVDLFQQLKVRSRTEALFVSLKSGILTLDDLD